MADTEIDPSDQDAVRKVLSTKIRNYFLIFIGIAVLVTGYFLVSGGAGSLFQGSVFPSIPGSEFPPTIVSTTPADGATNMPTTSGSITVVFDESGLTMDPTTNITILTPGSATNKKVSPVSYDDTLKSLTVNYASLEGNKAYTLTVPAATIKNGAEPMDSDLTLTFTSGTVPVDTTGDDDDDTSDDDDDTTGDDDDDDDDDDEDEEEEIEITDHDVFPVQFNPQTNETKISYEISADANIDIKIIDHTGVTILELLDDKEVAEGDYYVWWDGTDGTDVVASGEYQYKIFAKDPDDGEVIDIKSGDIKAKYAAAVEDFEDVSDNSQSNNNNVVSTSVTTTTTSQSQSQSQAAATMALQSAETGVTAETGPPVLFYLLFPLGGLFLSRKK